MWTIRAQENVLTVIYGVFIFSICSVLVYFGYSQSMKEYEISLQQKTKFINWCMEEYRNEPHHNLAQYCTYLYDKQITR